MRLIKATIGSHKDGPKHEFKNLKNVTIDFDEDHPITVVIGWNGTGKSNVLEALAVIFRDLIQGRRAPQFSYNIAYSMGSANDLRKIYIDSDPDREKDKISVRVADFRPPANGPKEGESAHPINLFNIRLSDFFAKDKDLLPRYVFSYYSGESRRMHDVFEPYLKDYYNTLLKSESDPPPKRLFYALPVHSQFVLLAFLINPDKATREFLINELGIDPDLGIESVLFVLRRPPWKSKKGDERFWRARGLVQRFLSRLMDVSIAPISVKRELQTSIWNKNRTELEYKYLFIKDIDALRDLVGQQPANEFFRDLESTYVSELIEEVRFRLRLRDKGSSTVTFRELSEGEQQLLTVLGLLRFTASEESLFLLDEPDTHLNPRWCVDYLSHLSRFTGHNGSQDSSHIVLTTHNPLSIADLVKEQVQILYRPKNSALINTGNPPIDPRGMGFAGIVTSEMFGLGSSLDNSTNQDLVELHRLSMKEGPLSPEDEERLVQLRSRLEQLDFNFASRDRLEQEYRRARFDLGHDNPDLPPLISPENRKNALVALVTGLLRDQKESAE